MSIFFPGYTQLPTWLTTEQDLYRRKANLFSFIFRGKQEALNKICTDWFNRPSINELKFRPFSDLVIVNFLNCYCLGGRPYGSEWEPCSHKECPKSELRSEKNQSLGIFKYNSIHFTVLVQSEDGQVYAFSPYSFIDETTGIVYAREIFGQTMTLADFYFPGHDENGRMPAFNLRVEVDDVTDYTTGLNVSQKALMAEITPMPREEGEKETSTHFSEHKGMVKIPYLIRKRLVRHTGKKFKQSEIKRVFEAGIGKSKLVALRQFRGTPTGDKAILKSVVSFLPGRTKVHRLGWLPGRYKLHIPSDNKIVSNHFPLKETLGLRQDAVSLAAFEAILDFQHLPFKTLWNSADTRRNR